MANAQGTLRFHHAREGDGGLAAAERAIALDADLAEAHAARARVLMRDARYDEAQREIDTALRLDPESYEVTTRRQGCITTCAGCDAIRHYEKAATVMEADYTSAGIIVRA